MTPESWRQAGALYDAMKDGVTKGASLFYAQLPDGKRLYHDIARPKTEGTTASAK